MKLKAPLTMGTLLLSATVLANEPAAFSELDRNGDGYIDEQEVQQHEKLAEVFDEADRDQDKRLSQQEFTYAMAKIRTHGDPRQGS